MTGVQALVRSKFSNPYGCYALLNTRGHFRLRQMRQRQMTVTRLRTANTHSEYIRALTAEKT